MSSLKNFVVIKKCVECSHWTPVDEYGGGVFCDELDLKLSDDIEFLIPDNCPKLKEMKEKYDKDN